MGKVDIIHAMNVRRAALILELGTSLALALRPGNNLGIHRTGWWVGRKITRYFETEKKIHVLEFKTRTAQFIKYEKKSLEIDKI
jgi:hypothetical protein